MDNDFVFMSEKGKKVLNIFKRIGIGLSIGFNVLFLVAVIVGSSGAKKQNNNVNSVLAESDKISDKIDFKNDNRKHVSYSDSDYMISFSVNEINNYYFSNLADLINSSFDNGNPSVTFNINYDNTIYYLDESIEDDYFWFDGDILFVLPGSTDFSDYANKFIRFDSSEDVVLDFEYTFYIISDSSNYESIKHAIELDIQGNEYGFERGIFETLTDSVVSFVGSLGSGIVAMTSVFYDSVNSQLTTIGLLSVIVVAVSLAYFLFRLIIGLIRMRG